MSWITYILIGTLLAFVFYTLELMNRLQLDIQYIKHHIEKSV